jgi:hypothetical protein
MQVFVAFRTLVTVDSAFMFVRNTTNFHSVQAGSTLKSGLHQFGLATGIRLAVSTHWHLEFDRVFDRIRAASSVSIASVSMFGLLTWWMHKTGVICARRCMTVQKLLFTSDSLWGTTHSPNACIVLGRPERVRGPVTGPAVQIKSHSSQLT